MGIVAAWLDLLRERPDGDRPTALFDPGKICLDLLNFLVESRLHSTHTVSKASDGRIVGFVLRTRVMSITQRRIDRC